MWIWVHVQSSIFLFKYLVILPGIPPFKLLAIFLSTIFLFCICFLLFISLNCLPCLYILWLAICLFNASTLFLHFADKLLWFKQGAKQIYANHLRPFLSRHQARVDQVLGFAYCEVVCLVHCFLTLWRIILWSHQRRENPGRTLSL